jgi:hypothetical protein
VTRFALIRSPGEEPHLVQETPLPKEAQLHEALTTHHELVPAEDLGLGRTAVVGWESGLASGYADLVLVDEYGQLCLVEVKKEGNPDTRRVVAQLLDYAAALWSMTLAEFESSVFEPFRTHRLAGSTATLAEHLGELVEAGDEDGDATDEAPAYDLTALEGTLASGVFKLVVAAPEIPPGVRRALEYLNGQGLRLFGLEVSYFEGPVECFVPRLVVKPTSADESKARRAPAAPLERESLLADLPDEIESFASSLLDECVEVGAQITWKRYGASIEVARGARARQVASIKPSVMNVAIQPPGRLFPPEPFEEARQALADLAVGSFGEKGYWYKVGFDEADQAALEIVRTTVVQLCGNLVRPMSWEPLAPKLQASFERNDFNVWHRQAPELATHEGAYLRGTLKRSTTGDESPVTLVPLTGGQPGWTPRFSDADDRARVWPHDDSGNYELRLDEVGTPQDES